MIYSKLHYPSPGFNYVAPRRRRGVWLTIRRAGERSGWTAKWNLIFISPLSVFRPFLDVQTWQVNWLNVRNQICMRACKNIFCKLHALIDNSSAAHNANTHDAWLHKPLPRCLSPNLNVIRQACLLFQAWCYFRTRRLSNCKQLNVCDHMSAQMFLPSFEVTALFQDLFFSF